MYKENKNSESDVRCRVLDVKRPSLRDGFTLMETIVSTSVFIIIVSIATGTFIQALKTQRAVSALASDNNNLTQAIEQMAREIRTGYRFNSTQIDSLNFTNYKQEFVSYKIMADGSIGRCANANELFCLVTGDIHFTPITSDKIMVNYLRFNTDGINDGDGRPPFITISVSVESEQGVETKLQTSVASRNVGS